MIYKIDNYAPDADAMNIAISNLSGGSVNVTVSRVEGGEVQISITQSGKKGVKRLTLGSVKTLKSI